MERKGQRNCIAGEGIMMSAGADITVLPWDWRGESACKPGSVLNGHSSGIHVTVHLKRPTRGPCGPHVATEAACPPIWSCSGWGLPCHCCYQQRGALLPHHFTLTNRSADRWRYIFCGTFRRLAPPRRYLAPCPSEPGLSSTFCKAATIRPTPGLEG